MAKHSPHQKFCWRKYRRDRFSIGGAASVSEGSLQYRKARCSIGRLAPVSEGRRQVSVGAAVRTGQRKRCRKFEDSLWHSHSKTFFDDDCLNAYLQQAANLRWPIKEPLYL